MKTLVDMGLTRASHIGSGFTGWVADGLPVFTYEEWRAARSA